MSEYNKQWAIEQLKNKFEELGRLPKKDDFDDASRSRIKAFLGPWPRALEEAGLKTSTKSHKSKGKHRKTRNLKNKESSK